MTWVSYLIGICLAFSLQTEELPLFYWQTPKFVNFGDYLSLELVERIVNEPLRVIKTVKPNTPRKLLAVGSILRFARDGDVIWGSGVSGKSLYLDVFPFSDLEVKAVRGPLTREFLKQQKGIDCPEVYGDPVLLFPYFFPEFEKQENPQYEYLVIPHYSEVHLFPKTENVIYPTDPWDEIVQKILNARFVISSSLHGIVLAEAYGIPARLLRVTEHEPLFKYQDYYLGSGRSQFQYASSVEEALQMGGEPPFICNLRKLYESFPFEYWGIQYAAISPIDRFLDYREYFEGRLLRLHRR